LKKQNNIELDLLFIYNILMGPNIHLKEEAISLRKKGESYNNIRKKLGLKSKGTLSHWFKDIKLSKKSIVLLNKNNKLAHERGLFKANKNRRTRIDTENEKSYIEGQSYIKSISKRDLLLIGAVLYWGEGTKSEKGNLSLGFSNSDPLMTSVYMKFVRKILKVPEERIRAGIHIYPSISANESRLFWSKVTNLPKDRFYIVTQISRASQNKRPFNILPYGTVAIKINNRLQFYKVKGMIKGIVTKTNSIIPQSKI